MAAVAGLKTMEILRRPGSYERLREIGHTLQAALVDSLSKRGIAHHIVGDPTLFDVVFTDAPVRNYRDWLKGDTGVNGQFNKVLREKGILKSPAKLYPCLALTEDDIAQTIEAIEAAAMTLEA